jgi:hypothetical protein
MKRFVVAESFSNNPGPRYRKQGKHSGEELCDRLVNLLREASLNNERLLVDLDGTSGYARSFIEEAFGGLVRRQGFSRHFLRNHLTLKSEEQNSLIVEAWTDIKDADQKLETEDQPAGDTVTPDPAVRNVKVVVKHKACNPDTRWCKPVDFVPTNVFKNHQYVSNEGYWLPAGGGWPEFGLVVQIGDTHCLQDQEVVVPLSTLRVFRAGNCENVGLVTID